MAPQLCVLLLLVLSVCSVSAWRASTTMSCPGMFRDCRGRGKRRSRPAWSPALNCEHKYGPSRLSMTAYRDGDNSDDESAAAWTYSKGKTWEDDGRDSLPFEVYDVVPPKRKIGTAKLPPLTSSGDTLWHGAKHYRVLRVSSHYKYEGGRFVMRKKVIDAKELARVATERFVARLVYGDGDRPPRES